MSYFSRIPGPFCQIERWLDVLDGTRSRLPSYSPRPEGLQQEVLADPVPVTSAQLQLIVPSLKKSAAKTAPLADDLNQAMRDAEIDNWIGQAMFIAQVAHESANFKKLLEDGGKTVFNTKTKVRSSYKDWKVKYPGKTVADTKDEEQIYDYFFFMYDKDSPDAKRQVVAKSLGNLEPGDGVRYRGRGYIQLTGRSNYRAAGKALGIDLEADPDLAANPNTAARVAGWFWKTRNLNQFTKLDNVKNFKAVTRRINGGYNGLVDRTAIYKRAKSVLKPAPTPAAVSFAPIC